MPYHKIPTAIIIVLAFVFLLAYTWTSFRIGFRLGEEKGRTTGYTYRDFEVAYQQSQDSMVELAPGCYYAKDTLRQILLHHNYFNVREHRFDRHEKIRYEAMKRFRNSGTDVEH